MFGLQPWHLIAIVVVALVIFGPSRLPELGRGLGKALVEFRAGTRDMTEGFREMAGMTGQETPATAPLQAQPHEAAGSVCGRCGAANLAGAQFCGQCGAPLGT